VSSSKPAEQLTFTITADDDGKRVDAALTAASGLSRNHLQQLIKDGRLISLTTSHPLTQPSRRVVEGERYRLEIPAPTPLTLTPENIPLDILYEDDDLIVVNKPAGMVVHPAHGHDHGTLVHALLHHCTHLSGINGAERPGIVHRLDKETSGSLVVAKSEQAHRRLSEMFARHDLNRQYLAWCRGNPNWHQRTIEAPIGRHPQQRQKMAIHPQGRMAITHAEIEQHLGPFCRVRLTLHTGRTHQIRVHLSEQRLPLIGDALYARNYNPGADIPEPSRSAIQACQRQALHAVLLAFRHPISGEPLSFHTPLPADLHRLDQALQQNYG